MIHATSEIWDSKVLESELPIFVDFWAEWCGPCQTVGLAVEQLSQELDGRIQVAKVNVDESPDIAARYGVRSIPSLLLFKGGKEIGRTVGAAPTEVYARFIEQMLA